MQQVSDEDNASLESLVEQLGEINSESMQESTLIRPVPFDKLLSKHTSSFFRYNGSLTTPACNQVVTWTVFNEPIYLSERQVSLFPYIIC